MGDATTQPASLQSLSVELQRFIIRLLDPIGLFSLSQASRYFRRTINPTRAEQIERFLALECLPEYGGDRPAILPLDRDQIVAGPDWNTDSWQQSRWACAFCLRLLSHTHFDNHFLLRRRWDARVFGECRYRRGELGLGVARIVWLGYPGGTPRGPIQTSRRLAFSCVLDRYLPGLEDSPESGPRPFPVRKEKISRADVFEGTWTMYMVRCSGCERWQELRAFRFGGHFKQWKPVHNGMGRLKLYTELHSDVTVEVTLDEVRCNGCFVREYGREALGRELLRLFGTSIQSLLHQAGLQLTRGWFCVKYDPIPQQYKKETQRMLSKVYDEEWDNYGQDEGLECVTYSRVATLRVLHAQFRDLWTRMRRHVSFVEEPFLQDAHFMTWLEFYHESEASWFWLRDFRREVEENPDILVAWALGRDSASLK
uniref:F-box domain-containing protein n=1 Tax=Bionectria ochroleuca TaxID=29856 RepID=A0A0B7KK73_BIOOC